jgi:2-polyprenyl-3-methyl-5-hydroxy-6-metoxy-1,4-benzoquinol methylase
MVGGFIECVRELAASTGAREIHEVGCGEGELSLALARDGFAVRGSDISAEVIEEARERARAAGLDVTYRAAPIEALEPAADGAELVVCCEVLEHLPDPDAGIAALVALARPWLLVSVPREPLWRALNLARGKYAGELGNTPGRFLEFVGERVEIVETRRPLPWTMVLGRVRP